MDNGRRRRSSRIDRWLREIGEADRLAAPLDFAEVALLSQHSCDPSVDGPAKPCTLRRSVLPDGSGGDCGPPLPHMQQQHQMQHHHHHHQQQQQQPAVPLPKGGHHGVNGGGGRTTEAAHLHHAAAPGVGNCKQQQQPPPPLPQPAVSESPLSTGSSSSSASLDFTSTESNSDLKQSSHSSSLASSLDSNKLKVVRREQQQNQQLHQLPQQPQQHQPRRPHGHGASGDNRQETSAAVAAAATAAAAAAAAAAAVPVVGAGHEKAATSGSGKDAAAGVTYYFHLSKSCSRERSQELLGQMKSLRDTDKPLQQIASARGVSISLGRGVEPAAAGSYRRKVVIQGSNWRSVMDSVNDLSQLYPDLMSQAVASIPGKQQQQHAEPGQHQQQQQRHHEHRPANPSKQRKQESKQPPTPPPPPPQPSQPQPQQPPPPQQHHKSSARQSASGSHTTAAVSGAGVSGTKSQTAGQPPPPPANPPASSGRQAKLAQNVRFQLTTQQRESLFTQDEAGKPTHPRLRHLLSTLHMDLVFLERSVNPDNVPSVKVRFFFESFDQLTAFCKAIDYQIPAQG